MQNGFTRRWTFVLAAVAALVSAVAAGASGGDRVVAKGLSDPRGIAVGPKGDVLVVETSAGDESQPGAVTLIAKGGKSGHETHSWDRKRLSVSVPGAVD